MTNKEQFITDAKAMWDIKKHGTEIELQPELTEVSTHIFRKFFKNRTIDFYYQKTDTALNIYIEESKDKADWFQNFLALTYKVGLGRFERKYHLGFYITATTIFNCLQRENLLTDNISIYGYSHGAGAAPILATLIKKVTPYKVTKVIGFEQPKYILNSSKELQEEGKDYIRYKQGNDIVTTVPWWMSHLGEQRKIDSPKYKSLKKKLLSIFYDHDIYWTREV